MCLEAGSLPQDLRGWTLTNPFIVTRLSSFIFEIPFRPTAMSGGANAGLTLR
jgi:hypothetical protein